MEDLQLVGFLAMVAVGHLEALLIPVGLAVAALLSSAPMSFEPVTI